MAALLLTPLLEKAMADGIDIGLQKLASIGGGKKRAADVAFGMVYQDLGISVQLVEALRAQSPDDQNLAFLGMQLAKVQHTAKSGMAIFDKAVDPVA